MSPKTSSEQIGVKQSGGQIYHFLDFLLGPIVFFLFLGEKVCLFTRESENVFFGGSRGRRPALERFASPRRRPRQPLTN